MSDKLNTLLEIEGYESEEAFMESAMWESTVPGICMNTECDYTTEVEPDQGRGWCEICNTKTVKSGLLILESI